MTTFATRDDAGEHDGAAAILIPGPSTRRNRLEALGLLLGVLGVLLGLALTVGAPPPIGP